MTAGKEKGIVLDFILEHFSSLPSSSVGVFCGTPRYLDIRGRDDADEIKIKYYQVYLRKHMEL